MILAMPCAVFAEDTASAVSSNGTVISTFSDNFATGLLKWTEADGKGFSTNSADGLCFNNMKEYLKPSALISNKSGFKKFKLNTQITPKNGDYAGIYLRYSEDAHYLLQFCFSTDKIVLLKKQGGGLYSVLKESMYDFKYGTPFELEVFANGGRFSISVDGTNYIELTDSAPIQTGKIGVRGFHSAFTVKSINAEVYEADKTNSEEADTGRLVNLGMPESYKPVAGNTTKERFLSRKAEIPNELNVVKVLKPTGKGEIYVSPDGSDDNDGSFEKPVKTLKKAVALTGDFKVKNGIVIYLRGGVYEYSDTLSLSNLKGTSRNPIFISAYNDEKVTFIGGTRIPASKFSKITNNERLKRLDPQVRDKVKVVDLKSLKINTIQPFNGAFNGANLFMNGENCTLARYPNFTYAKVEKVIDQGPLAGETDDGRGFTIGFVSDAEPLTWKQEDDIRVRGGFYYEWNQVYTNITIDQEKRAFNSNGTKSSYGARTGADFFYYNVFEELNFPGEYYIDRKNMQLYLYPIGELNNDSRIFLATFPNNKPLIQMDACANIVFNNIDFEAGNSQAVLINNCDDVVVQRCNFQNFGANEIEVKNSRRCGLTSCTLMKFGNRSMYVSGRNHDTYEPNNNFIQNCAIHGNKDQMLNSMTSFGDIGGVMSHNLYTNGYATGAGTMGIDSVIEYNEFVASPKYQLDSGCTYGGGEVATGMMSNQIRYNFLHDVLPNSKNTLTRTIYLDVMASDNMAYGNISYNAPAGYFSHGGRQNVIYNNISVNMHGTDAWAATNSLNMWGKSYDLINVKQYNNNSFADTAAVRARFPHYAVWVDKVKKVIADHSKPGWVRNDEYNDITAPKDFYYAQNVSALNGGKFVYYESDTNDTTEGLETNYTCETDPFVDVKNYNFNLKPGNEIQKNVPGWEEIPFDKMGLIIGEDYMKVRPYLGQYGEIFAFSPVNGDKGTQLATNVEFMWTDVPWANRYRLEIATDKDFKNVVYDKTDEYEYATVDLKEYGKTFYWRVTATTLCKSVDPTPLKSEVFSFTTMTEEEAAEVIRINTAALDEAIESATTIYDAIVEGNKGGQYASGTRAALKKVIDKAKNITRNPESQKQVLAMVEELQSETIGLRQKEIYGFTDLTFKPDEWQTPATDQFTKIYDAKTGTLTLGSQHGTGLVERKQKTKFRSIYRFQMMMDSYSDWWGTTTHWDQYSRTRYFYVIQPSQIELQVVRNGNSRIVRSKQNDMQVMKPGVWYEIEIGQVLTGEGMWCYYKLDDEVLFSYIDTNPNLNDGVFQFMLNPANGNVNFRPTAKKDEQLPEIPTLESLGQDDRIDF